MRNLDLTQRALCRLLSGPADDALTSSLGLDNWRLVAATARREGVAPLLYHVLNEAGWPADVPSDVQGDLRQSYYATTARNLLIYRELSRIVTALSAPPQSTTANSQYPTSNLRNPIPTIILKGAALAATVYDSIGLRPMGDLDFLVPEDRLAETVARLKAMGYVELHPKLTPGLQAIIGYDFPLKGGRDISLIIEPHWSLIGGEESRYRPKIDWFWEQVEMADLLGIQALILKPTAHLLYLAAHLAIKHGEAHSPLRWFHDIHLLVTREGHRVDWKELTLRAQEFHWAPALHTALTGTATRFATPLPTGILESLTERVGLRDQALVQRKTRPQTRWQSTTDQLTSLSWRARLRLLLAYAIPSGAYVRWRYKPRPAWLWRLCYPYRWLDILCDGLATLWKIASSRIADGISQEEHTDIHH